MTTTTLQTIAYAMLDSDIEQGHANADTQWGRYEVLARVSVETLKDKLAGSAGDSALTSILLTAVLEGKL
jgi:hypothetical protein